MNTITTVASNVSPPAPQFFVDHKRGEVNELRQLLRTAQQDRDVNKKREAIKKVIAYMTLGIDVSQLYSEMIMASSTSDLVQKKMIYLYLTNYAEHNRDLTVLTINTFLKDCQDDDPTIRGLALRSLCSLKLSNVSEYIEKAVRIGLKDPNPYVRRTSVIGILKLYSTSPNLVVGSTDSAEVESDYLRILDNLVLQDPDALVVVNAIYAINEIKSASGGIALNRDLMTSLINRLKSFDGFSLCQILTMVSAYVTSLNDVSDIYDILNIMEDHLKSSSASIVLGVSKCFLEICVVMPRLTKQIINRLKDPLLTLACTAATEVAYIVSTHIQLIVSLNSDGREVFAPHFKLFFCRYHDPSYMKKCKIDLLTSLASIDTFPSIQLELSDYVSDVDTAIAKRSILALGLIALRVPTAAESVFTQLLSFLSLHISYVSSSTLMVLMNLLRKYPQHFNHIVKVIATDFITTVNSTIDEIEGLCALLWMIGESTNDVLPDAPYLLEYLMDLRSDAFCCDPPEVDKFPSNQLSDISNARTYMQNSTAFKISFITAAAKCLSLNEAPNVRDRGLLYYRLLKSDVEDSKRIILSEKEPIEDFEDVEDVDHWQRMLLEFNSMSVVYGKLSSTFMSVKPIPFSGHVVDDRCDNETSESMDIQNEELDKHHDNLDDTDGDILTKLPDIDRRTSNGDSAPLISFNAVTRRSQLSPVAPISPAEFADAWAKLDLVLTDRSLELPSIEYRQLKIEAIEAAFTDENIHCIASGTLDCGFKFYFCTKFIASGVTVLLEMQFHLSDEKTFLFMKTLNNSSRDDACNDAFQHANEVLEVVRSIMSLL